MARSTIVHVTTEHIAEAKRCDGAKCMIAEAVKASVPNASSVYVDLATIRYTQDGYRRTFLTPEHCRNSLIAFDHGIIFEPWSFRLPAQPVHIRKVRAKTDALNTKKRPTKRETPNVGNISDTANYVPIVRGGDSPPLGALVGGAGRRRVFGARVSNAFLQQLKEQGVI